MSVLIVANALSIACAADAPNKVIDVSAYMMEESREVAIARSAAPDFVSEDASVMALREGGYEIVAEGTNGFVCLVLRSWGESTFNADLAYDPTTIDPECLNSEAASVILPMQLYRAQLGLVGTPPEEIREKVQAGFREGRFTRVEGFSFSYMLSTAMNKHPPPYNVLYARRLGRCGIW